MGHRFCPLQGLGFMLLRSRPSHTQDGVSAAAIIPLDTKHKQLQQQQQQQQQQDKQQQSLLGAAEPFRCCNL